MRPALRALVRHGLRELRAYQVPRPDGVPVKLDANEAPRALPAEVAAALAAELAAVDLRRYPDAAAAELRARLAADAAVEPGAIVLGNGSDELIGLLAACFAEPRPGAARARVLYPVPSFSVYRTAALAAGAEPIEVPLRERDYQLDEGALDEAIAAARPNLMFFARPNNPTGTLWSRAALERVLRRCPDSLIVVDEAYIDYGGDTLLDLLDDADNLIVLRTLSKIGLAGARVGYLIAAAPIVAELEKVRPPYNLSSLDQRAAAWLLAHHGELLRAGCAEVRAERDRLHEALAALPGVDPYPSAANLILFHVDDAAGLWRRLRARGVLVRRFDGPGRLGACLRVTVGARADNDRFLAALRAALAG